MHELDSNRTPTPNLNNTMNLTTELLTFTFNLEHPRSFANALSILYINKSGGHSMTVPPTGSSYKGPSGFSLLVFFDDNSHVSGVVQATLVNKHLWPADDLEIYNSLTSNLITLPQA